MKIFSNSELKSQWFLKKVVTSPMKLCVIAALIPLVGLLLDLTLLGGMFPRSGALLVCFAIYCVFLNHFVTIEIDGGESFLKYMSDLGETEEQILKRVNPAIQGDARTESVKNLLEFKGHTEEQLTDLRIIRSNIVTAEFLAGISGTFIWGFGDMLIKLIEKLC